MEIRVIEKGHGAIVKISGQVSHADEKRMEEELQKLINPETHEVVVDLHDTQYIGSAAICRLVVIGKKMNEKNMVFSISPSENIKNILTMGGVNKMFPMVKDPEKAVHG